METNRDDFWKNPLKASKINQEIEGFKKEFEEWKKLRKDFKNLKNYLVEIKEEEQSILEIIVSEYQEIQKKIIKLEKKTLFQGKYDKNNVILEIYAGAGGDDAQDWAEMLMRMYLRFSENKKWKTKILNKTEGGEAGIKNVIIEVIGDTVFGNLKSEKGVHRLVRQSPFNADALRQTSFAAVEIWPILDNEEEVKINPNDLRVDVFKSSGAGGQSVNTTDSAVRITHIPTNTVVVCQNERSQIKNRELAMKVLKARLHQYLEERQKEEQQNIKGEHKSAGWGNQIRSYVFHPYKMIKDHRTGYEVSEIEGVMNGEIEDFIEEYLRFFQLNNKKNNTK